MSFLQGLAMQAVLFEVVLSEQDQVNAWGQEFDSFAVIRAIR
jgi:hypothetical protein